MLRVLLVEDNPIYARLVEALLVQAHGDEFAVTVTHGLTEAEAHLHTTGAGAGCDVVLLDLFLPEAEGAESVRRVIAAAPTVPVVVLTAHSEEPQALAAMRAGAQDFLIKNQFTAAGLRRALLYAVERASGLRALGHDGALVDGLFNSLHSAVGVLEAERAGDGRVVDFRWRLANAACQDLLGLPPREMAGKRLSTLLPCLVEEGLIASLAAVADGQRDLDVERRVARPDRTLWLRVGAARLGDGVALSLTDISGLKDQERQLLQARDEAEAAATARSRILSALSHQVRQPLNTVLGFAELMDREVMGPVPHDQYRAYIHDICASARQIDGILEQLLERSHVEALARLDGSYRELIDLTPDLICVCRDGMIEMINAAGAAMIGVKTAAQAIGRAFAEFVHPDYRPIMGAGLSFLLAESGRVPMKLATADGREVDVELAATPIREDAVADGTAARPGGGAVLLVARDVTQRQVATRAIIQREEKLRKIMATMVDALVIIDQRGTIETFNPAAERMFGYRAAEVVGRSVNLLMPEDFARGHDGHMLRYLATGASDKIGIGREIAGRRRDGTQFPLEIALSELRLGDRRFFIGVLRDITERKQAEERLRFLATRDPLTGLPNRALFRDHLERAVARADAEGLCVGVLFIDIDHFKNINDTLGHSVGDRLLQAVAQRLEQSLRPGDFVAHLAGDEFTVILEPRPPAGSRSAEEDGSGAVRRASKVAEKIHHRLGQPFDIDGKEIFTSCSIGIVAYPDNADTLANLMQNVDTAVHHAKKLGRNTIQVYSESLSQAMVRRLQLENGLRRALDRQELRVVYQPKVSLRDGTVSGAEALLRWNSADLGVVSPGEFIPVAEETGLIVPIGDWILREVCAQIDRWTADDLPAVRIAVNLSARQFRDQGLTSRVMSALDAAGISAELLELELTESMLVENADEVIQALWALKGLGITLSIDDFGTGYSSLSYLKRFPIDALKIDQSFVRDIPDSSDDMSIVKAIISMGRSLDLKLVAEGVETIEQVEFLRANGCHLAQGYHFARPLDAEAFARYLARDTANGSALPAPAAGATIIPVHPRWRR